MKTMRKIIEIDDELCDGCGQCVPSCAEGAIQIVNGKARIISENLCDGLGACMGDCPNGALKIIEREADEFDEQAVEAHLTNAAKKEPEKPLMACGCPSQQVQSFTDLSATLCSDNKAVSAAPASALAHWPVQIRLIPAEAPFLKNADLLITADCAAVAHPSLHTSLLPGQGVMMGCPKLDDTDEYIEKFKSIFSRADIKSVTILLMEVPCCAGLPWIVKKGLEAAKTDIPVTEIMINGQGKIISESQSPAPEKKVRLVSC